MPETRRFSSPGGSAAGPKMLGLWMFISNPLNICRFDRKVIVIYIYK